MRDLLKNPIWKNLELGYSIPDSEHAVSVALPTWNDVINYEEKNPECIKSLVSSQPIDNLIRASFIPSKFFVLLSTEA